MRGERWIFGGLAIYFLVVAAIYYVMSQELIGTFALLLTGIFAAMVAAFLAATARKIDPRPEDDQHGEIVQGAGELGFFPPKSIWPFWVALTITIILLGPVFGLWITLLGIGMGIWAGSGWVFEYYRGDYAH